MKHTNRFGRHDQHAVSLEPSSARRWALDQQDDTLATSPSASEDPLPPESIRVQLARILRSRTFSNAPTLGRFLNYLVESSLDGSADRLKEYALGVEVFEQDDMFARSPSTSECPLPPEWIRDQLARILRSQTFSNAPSLMPVSTLCGRAHARRAILRN